MKVIYTFISAFVGITYMDEKKKKIKYISSTLLNSVTLVLIIFHIPCNLLYDINYTNIYSRTRSLFLVLLIALRQVYGEGYDKPYLLYDICLLANRSVLP
jgi:hypothetical protein